MLMLKYPNLLLRSLWGETCTCTSKTVRLYHRPANVHVFACMVTRRHARAFHNYCVIKMGWGLYWEGLGRVHLYYGYGCLLFMKNALRCGFLLSAKNLWQLLS